MAENGGGEKTEHATPKRKKDERKKGNVFSSKDIVAAFFILIVFFTIKVTGKLILTTMSSSMVYWIEISGSTLSITQESLHQIAVNVVKTVLIVAGPILIVGVIVPIIFTGMQTRFIFSMDALKFKFSRLNPIEGIKKLFSLRSIVELVKNLIKIAIISAIIFNEIEDRIVEIVKLFDVDIKIAIVYLCTAIYSAVISIAIIFIFMGIVDILYQWWEFEKNLKMSKQEIKEEFKQMEGDPQLKGKIKQKQREMSQARMMKDIPTADVIIRNPTHFAVAIKYDPESNHAPKVIAKGMDFLALKIIAVAEEHKIVLTENKPLARALYDAVEVGQEIPEEFYHTVAEVLAFVYELKNKKLK